MKVNILGTEYTVEHKARKEDPALKNCGGYCNEHDKRIVVRAYSEDEKKDPEMCKNVDALYNRVLRHEIVHAFFNESGLSHDSFSYDGPWAKNEELTDWMAVQLPKMVKAFSEVGCL